MTNFKWATPILSVFWLAGPVMFLSAQPTVGFHRLNDTLALGAKGVSYTYQIPISISSLPAENEPVIIEVIDLKTGSANPKMYKLEETSLVFANDRKQVQQAKINILGNYADLPEYDVHLMISIIVGWAKLDIGTFFLILKTPESLQNNDHLSSYKLSLGANFDLIDGLSINSNYTDISIFHNQIWNPKNNSKSILPRERWGMDIWLYQSRSVSGNQSTNNLDTFTLGSTNPNDSFLLEHNSSYTRDNLGVYLSPLFRLNKIPQSVQNPMQIYLMGQMEFTRSRVLISGNEIDALRRDSFPTQISYIGYGGMGFLFHHSSKSVDFMLKFSGGISFFDNPINCPLGKNKQKASFRNPWFYQTQLRIQENQFGLKLGADIRGFFRTKNQAPFSQYFYPVFTLFLAKEFSFTQIGKLFGPVGERK